ncbi:MAG: MFS transporter [Sphingomonas sp.]|uniref:MFS transporter n=1 Tax=Sphingomonas sp. TaxID=28214 RepID=UPI001AC51981|nr:MFS transporter [Sphingomonas sp.]MBN8816815.1 MFS transporter [Sphingomonas sp.]
MIEGLSVRHSLGPLGLTGYQWFALLLCALTFLIEGYDMAAMPIAAPTLGKELGVNATRLGTAIVALNIGAIIGNGFLAPIGDRFSRKWTVTISTVLLGICVTLTATAASITQVVAWRFISGLAFGVATANVVALMADQFPRNRRALLVVLAATNLPLGSALCGFGAAGITAALGWRGLFVIGGVAGIALGLVIGAALRGGASVEVREEAEPSEGLAGKGPILRLFEPGLIGVTLPLWLLGFCNASILFVMLNWLPTMLTGIGWTLGESTRAPAIVSIGGVMSGIVLAFLVDIGRAAVALRFAFLALIVTMALFLVVPPSVPVWTGMLLIAGLLSSGSHTAERGLYATLYPKAVRATGVGWGNMMSRLGNVIGTLTAAVLIDLKLDVSHTLGMMVVPATIALLCTIPLGRADRRRRAAESAMPNGGRQ